MGGCCRTTKNTTACVIMVTKTSRPKRPQASCNRRDTARPLHPMSTADNEMRKATRSSTAACWRRPPPSMNAPPQVDQDEKIKARWRVTTTSARLVPMRRLLTSLSRRHATNAISATRSGKHKKIWRTCGTLGHAPQAAGQHKAFPASTASEPRPGAAGASKPSAEERASSEAATMRATAARGAGPLRGAPPHPAGGRVRLEL
mmetsp:Transcript_28656/g.86616  ORF Transcript_28656/g.86616 Transcript_28656/m.86616 type:complete len:203 (+) Transcript_28656:324-932(+)